MAFIYVYIIISFYFYFSDDFQSSLTGLSESHETSTDRQKSSPEHETGENSIQNTTYIFTLTFL